MWIDKDGKPSPGWIILEMTFIDEDGHEEKRLMRIFNPTDEQYREAGWTWQDPQPPTPDPDYERRYQEYLTACAQFRSVCGLIKTFAGLDKFTGGFDEAMEFIQSETFAANMVQGTYLFSLWQGADKAATYAASKINIGQPEWWYDCWQQVEPEPTPEPDPTPEPEPEVPEMSEPEITEEPAEEEFAGAEEVSEETPVEESVTSDTPQVEEPKE